MEDKRKHPKPFDSVCHDFDLPIDNHDKAAAEQQGARWIGLRVGQMPTAFHHPVLRSASDSYLVPARNYNQDTRVLTPGQPPPLAAPETRHGNGEDPASLELTRPEVGTDSESPPDVRDPPKDEPPASSVRKRPLSAHGIPGHISQQADDDSKQTAPHPHRQRKQQPYDDLEHDGPRKQKKKKEHVLKNKRPKV